MGYGARHAAAAVRVLAERLGAGVLCTPRAKGVFPERHPLYVGVTGAGGHEATAAYVEQVRPRRTLVLGSRLGEASSFWDPRLVPEEGFIHVDLNASAFGAAYPAAPTDGVEAEIGAFIEALLRGLQQWPARAWPQIATPFPTPPALGARAPCGADGRCVIVDGSDALVLTESGNAFGFGKTIGNIRAFSITV